MLTLGLILLPQTGIAASIQDKKFTDCTCVTASTNSSAALGTITLAKGDVSYNGTNGFEGAKAGTPILAGSEISVSSGSADISVGTSCKLKISENKLVSVSQPAGADGNICVKVASMVPAFEGQYALEHVPNNQNLPSLPGAIFSAVVIGSIVEGAFGDGGSVSD